MFGALGYLFSTLLELHALALPVLLLHVQTIQVYSTERDGQRPLLSVPHWRTPRMATPMPCHRLHSLPTWCSRLFPLNAKGPWDKCPVLSPPGWDPVLSLHPQTVPAEGRHFAVMGLLVSLLPQITALCARPVWPG